MNKWLKLSGLFIFVVVGAAIILLGSKFKSHPEKLDAKEFATTTKYILVPKVLIKTTSSAFGKVSPARSWDAISEVSGKIVYLASKLKDGVFIKKGDLLLKIDDTQLQLNLAQINAQLSTSKVKDETTRLSISTKKKELVLLQKEYDRQKKLAKKGAISQSASDTSHRAVLSLSSILQTLQNSLLINKAEREVLLVQKQQVEIDLSHTTIKAPLNARVTLVKFGLLEYVNKGQLLISADGLKYAEIESQFPIGKLRPLVSRNKNNLQQNQNNWAPGVIGLDARVSLQSDKHSVFWDATVKRVTGSIDPKTQTLGIVAVVEKPYKDAISGKGPPLIRNMFVKVTLHSKNKNKYIVIPRSAMHEGKVFVINDEDRLEIRKVKVDFYQKGYVVINKGLKAKEKLVTSDLVPAIEGMLLKPIIDKKSKKQLIISATGKTIEQLLTEKAND